MKHDYSRDLFPPALLLPIKVCTAGTTEKTECRAKVDTGADISVLPESIRRELRLPPRGFAQVRGIMDKKLKTVPTYSIIVYIAESRPVEVEVISAMRRDFLMGRDVLNRFVLFADGPGLSFDLNG